MIWIYRHIHDNNKPIKCGDWFVIDFGRFSGKTIREEYLEWYEVGQYMGGN